MLLELKLMIMPSRLPPSLPSRPEISPRDLTTLIRLLQGQAEPVSTSNLSSIERLQRLSLTDLSSRLIELRLHPETYRDLLARVPFATREAWKTGKKLDAAPNRIRVAESEAAKCKAEGLDVGTRRLHSDARGWFEDCAKVGRGKGKTEGKKEG